MNGYKLVEAAKEKTGISTDNGIATKLGIDRGNIYNWKIGRSAPNGEQTLMLADMANVTPKEALRIMQSGYSSLSILIMTALTSTLGIASLIELKDCILC